VLQADARPCHATVLAIGLASSRRIEQPELEAGEGHGRGDRQERRPMDMSAIIGWIVFLILVLALVVTFVAITCDHRGLVVPIDVQRGR
jgi:hypothetical protein